jgi:LmbE family N-acetylglucosaminyl deacetylase
MAKAATLGHRVVLVVATRGELGARPPEVVAAGEDLGERRVAETHAAGDILGVDRIEFLGYRDSGMMGSPDNGEPGSFWCADLDEAAARLAAILNDEHADLLLIYDENGVTGHPDHIQAHRVGVRAAQVAATAEVVEGTLSRSQAARLVRFARGADITDMTLDVDPGDFGTPDDVVTDRIDVRAYLDRKRRAMAAHASQISETSVFLSMPPDTFAAVWGEECLIRRGPASEVLAELR